MRVLVATPLYPPDIGGPATHAVFIEGELPVRGVDISLVSFRAVRHLPKVVRHIAYGIQVLRAGKDTDLIYALDPVSVGLPARVAAFLLRKRFILRVPGDYAWEQGVQRAGVTTTLDDFSAVSHNSVLVRLLKLVERLVAKSAEQVVVPSLYLKDIVLRWGVSPERISVVYSSFTPPVFSSKHSIRSALSLTGPVVLSAGRLVPWKGFAALIDACAELVHEEPDLLLVIAGDGPDRMTLESRAEALGVERHVRFTGALPQNIFHEYLRAADVFVLNSGYEGFSHALLEAAAAETVIVASRVGGNPELVHDGETGCLVDYNDREGLVRTIRTLLTETRTRTRMAAAAKASLARFTTEAAASALTNIFHGSK